ncbi:hypothetical protein ACOMHN_003914 [Nucella lapillus]
MPSWPDFKQHFECNLVKECAGGEDESECPYIGHCGQHRLTIGGRCYQLFTRRKYISWIHAHFSCLSEHGYLASLNSATEWQQVTDVLAMRKSYLHVSFHNVLCCPPALSPPSFHCTSDKQRVSYTLVCDHRPDCSDASDERFCVFPLVTASMQTHFQCHNNGYCLPVFVRCNVVKDCPEFEDENDCDSYTCPGFYRCRGSKVCVHVSQVLNLSNSKVRTAEEDSFQHVKKLRVLDTKDSATAMCGKMMPGGTAQPVVLLDSWLSCPVKCRP